MRRKNKHKTTFGTPSEKEEILSPMTELLTRSGGASKAQDATEEGTKGVDRDNPPGEARAPSASKRAAFLNATHRVEGHCVKDDIGVQSEEATSKKSDEEAKKVDPDNPSGQAAASPSRDLEARVEDASLQEASEVRGESLTTHDGVAKEQDMETPPTKNCDATPAATSGRRGASSAETSAEEEYVSKKDLKDFMQMMQDFMQMMQAMQETMSEQHAYLMKQMQAMVTMSEQHADFIKKLDERIGNNEKIALSQEASIKLIDIQDLEDNVKVEHAQERREVQAEDTFRGSLPKDPDIIGKKLRGKSRSSSNNRACNQKWRSAGSHNLHRSGRTSISRMSLDQKPQKGRQRRVHATKDGQKWRSAGSHNLHRSGRTSISRMSLDQKPKKGRQRRVHAIRVKDKQVSALIMDLMPEYRFGDKPP